jgi:hypothetical protein
MTNSSIRAWDMVSMTSVGLVTSLQQEVDVLCTKLDEHELALAAPMDNNIPGVHILC